MLDQARKSKVEKEKQKQEKVTIGNPDLSLNHPKNILLEETIDLSRKVDNSYAYMDDRKMAQIY